MIIDKQLINTNSSLFHFLQSFKLNFSKNDANFLYSLAPSLMKLFKIPKHMNFVQHQAFGKEQLIENIEQ